MVDVPVGQIAFVQIMLSVIAVQVVPCAQKVSRGVTPGCLAFQRGDMVLDGVHHLVNVIMAAKGLVHIVGNQLNGQVAGNAPHAHQAAVHSGIAAQVLVQKFLRQAERERHVLMQVQPHADIRGQVVVHQADDAL